MMEVNLQWEGNTGSWKLCGLSSLEFEGKKLVNRDRLVSTLLQDRSALRIISAPYGYGKSTLAYEYALRMHARGNVLWVNASSPEFLRSLDKGELYLHDKGYVEYFDLIVLDELPILDEERIDVLSENIDMRLYEGTEIIVTTAPSRDCLHNIQPDHIILHGSDLAVTESEFRRGEGAPKDAGMAAAEWTSKQQSLMGDMPQCVWGDQEAGVASGLASFFDEKLPLDVLSCAFCILLMRQGDFDDVRQMGLSVRTETENLLIKGYPFLGIDSVHRSFNIGVFPFEALRDAIEGTGLAEPFARGTFPLTERVVNWLLDQGEARRAKEVLDCFCSDDRCGSWLKSRGYDLLDCGEGLLVESLFNRCPERQFEQDRSLQALKSWSLGLRGDEKEAGYYARKVLRCAGLREASETDEAGLMAYLALVAFGGSATIYAKGVYACSTPVSPMDYLAAVVDSCSEDELTKALSGLFGLASGQSLLQANVDEDPSRLSALEQLYTHADEFFRGTLVFRFAFHLIQHVAGGALLPLMEDASCGLVIDLRRRGVTRYSEALLIADLWRGGYFGLSARELDVRDSHVLEEAGVLLSRMNHLHGGRPIQVPWEATGLARAAEADEGTQSKKRKRKAAESKVNGARNQAPVANVRLFGGFDVTVGDRFLPESQWRRKALMLFSILTLFQGRDVSRETIYELLWPNFDKARAADNFYTAWAHATTTLGKGPYMERAGDFCRINQRFVNSDVGEFELLAKRLLTERDDTAILLDIYARMEGLYRGGLLPGEGDNKLVVTQRARLRSMFVDSMVAATRKALEAQDARIALWFARKAMEEDGSREDVYHALISAQIASGQRCSAIKTFFQCQHYLREELGLDPSVQTRGLYDKLISTDPTLLKLKPADFRV